MFSSIAAKLNPDLTVCDMSLLKIDMKTKVVQNVNVTCVSDTHIWQTVSSGLNFAAIEENIHNAPQTWYMSCKIMLILTVRPLAFQGYTILHITYLNFLQKLEFFEKNRKKSRNSRFLLMTIFSMLFANSFNSQGHLIAKKKICGRGYIITCAAFFSFWEKMILSTQTCCE